MPDSEESVKEHDIHLDQYDIDHLNDGQPVYKGIGEDTLVILWPPAHD